MELQHLIDDRNRSLWESIKLDFKINDEKHPGDHFYHHILEKEIFLFIPEENGSIELFTHEMLHLQLLSKGITITSYLKSRLRHEPLLHWSFNENLFEQIGNCLEHYKMLPLYLSMGFERDLFTETYYMQPCSEMNMQIIKCGMNKDVPSKASVDMFIHKFFAVKACLNPDFTYDHYLAILESINPELFKLLETFWNNWQKFEIENNHLSSFKGFTYDFMHELGSWNIMNIYARENVRA